MGVKIILSSLPKQFVTIVKTWPATAPISSFVVTPTLYCNGIYRIIILACLVLVYISGFVCYLYEYIIVQSKVIW